MAMTKAQIEARLETEDDPDVIKALKKQLANLPKGKEDEGDFVPIGAVTQEDWDGVKGKKVEGTFEIECGIGYWFNEKNIAVPYTLVNAPFGDGNALILIPVSPGAAFKSKEIITSLGIPSKVDSDGRIMLRAVTNSDGQDTFPDFAGKKGKAVYKDQGRTYQGTDGGTYPSIDLFRVLPMSAEVEDLGV